jgi:hypothetical protein
MAQASYADWISSSKAAEVTGFCGGSNSPVMLTYLFGRSPSATFRMSPHVE